MHWIPEEVPLAGDVYDWNNKLTDAEKHLLTQIFRFFTQADVDVAKGYIKNYLPHLSGHPEVAMMLTTFASMEAVHVDAYSLLIETVGMPESEYQAFSQYKEMAAKHDFLDGVTIRQDPITNEEGTIRDLVKAIAINSGFGEGLQLFSSFAILLNFSRFGKMRGMSQIVTWSIADETVHVDGMLQLMRELISENYSVWTDELRGEIYEACRVMVELEDNFIDLAFAESNGDIQGLDKEEVKQYIRYIADRRLLQMGLKTNYGVKHNPLPWLEEILSTVEHANFFEARVTEYQKNPLTGTLDFAKLA